MPRYRLKAGRHSEGGKTFNQGETFTSKHELERLYPENLGRGPTGAFSQKFERIVRVHKAGRQHQIVDDDSNTIVNEELTRKDDVAAWIADN